MKVKIFYGRPSEVEKQVNVFLGGVPVTDIHKVETVAFPKNQNEFDDLLAVLIWTRE